LEERMHHFMAMDTPPPEQEDEAPLRFSEADFHTATAVAGALSQKRVIEFGEVQTGGDPSAEGAHITFHTSPQPVFNRRFDLLIRDLQQKESDHYALFLFAENPKQLERLRAIFE